MDARVSEAYENLKSSLEDLSVSYQKLLTTINSEKKFLINSKIDDLNQNNLNKESLLSDIKTLDIERQKRAFHLATILKIGPDKARLLELAKGLPLIEAEIFRDYHRKLSQLMERVVASNKDNEIYAQSAIRTLGRAMDNVKEALVGKKIYAPKGNMKDGPMQSGNFVSKEA